MTDLPYNARELETEKCGIIVSYDERELANAIIMILKDESLLQQYKENAAKYSLSFDWNKIFEKALASVA